MMEESHDLFSEQNQRKSQIVGILLSYCRRYRLSNLEARRVSPRITQEVAREVLDFFEHRLSERTDWATPTEGSPQANNGPVKSNKT